MIVRRCVGASVRRCVGASVRRSAGRGPRVAALCDPGGRNPTEQAEHVGNRDRECRAPW